MITNMKFFIVMMSCALLAAENVELKKVSLVPEQIQEAITKLTNESNYSALTTYIVQQKSAEETQELVLLLTSYHAGLIKMRDSFGRNNYGKAWIVLPLIIAVAMAGDSCVPKEPALGFSGARVINTVSILVWAAVPVGFLMGGITAIAGSGEDVYYHVIHVERQIEQLELLIAQVNQ